MELLTPTPPPQLAGPYFSGIYYQTTSLSSLGSSRDRHHDQDQDQDHSVTPLSPEFTEEVGDRITVAVGKVHKTLPLLHFCFRKFGCREIVLLHVHQPSSTIPTLLGKLPASQANEGMVSAHRREEMEQTRKLLFNYLAICRKAQVKARVITIEAAQIKKGIVDLVNKHRIRKLVMGAPPDNCMKVKKSSSKANFAAKNAPPFCEIWFVYKGKHVSTRDASEGLTILPSVISSSDAVLSERLSATSSCNLMGEPISSHMCLQTDSLSSGTLCFGVGNQIHTESESDSKAEEESLCNQLKELMRLAETSRNEALTELVKCKNSEAEVFEAINKVKVFDSSLAREIKLREEVEDILRITRQQQEKLLEQREEVTRDLQEMTRNVAVLNIHLQESTRRREEAAGELGLIQAFLATIWDEREKLQEQKAEAMCQLEQWRGRGHAEVPNCDGSIRYVNESFEFTEFSLSELQTATFNFSESFKIGEGGYGCVYKGEIFNRSVAIKKLHPYSMQGRSEFQQEVLVLSKLQHPNLVNLIGACPEAWSLVYEYLPNGSLQDHLFRRCNTAPLTWKTRTRIAAKISSALLFLHSSKPKKIIHGDLKPENILLDSDFNCKIGDFGICRLVPEESVDFPSFRRNTEPKSAFPYTDPELQRNGNLTPKSDIYSFGIIILQLLTGRPPVGLTNEVHRAVLCGKLTSILDTSAGEWPTSVVIRLADVGLQCCELNSRDRPELTPAMVRELDQLHVAEELPVPSFFLCPILREVMHDPHVAADGFTYEGEAIRGWLEDGHDTSPMTNLKMSHLHLTPNHAIRHAIQDWLSQS
ncbi:U-box domain-containing protein 33-like isoform X2 [Macadamia integrifolia]|uniref:U-box domain-containing protein 33-like isoform X2 n=1 Tax=Macadamia integrifolia TaxID=60698 RepID=UPI001C530BA7|nr:U-box domain-containing protein 33-like isoform X2 [Macadamia integrifolia]